MFYSFDCNWESFESLMRDVLAGKPFGEDGTGYNRSSKQQPF